MAVLSSWGDLAVKGRASHLQLLFMFSPTIKS